MSGFWQQFTATASFLEPCEIVGVVTERDQFMSSDGPAPVLAIRLDNGVVVRVNVVQEQLLFKLAMADPDIGDRLRIRYLGEAKRAAPGMSPTKLFTVEVRRADSQPPNGPAATAPPTNRSEAAENAKGAGK